MVCGITLCVLLMLVNAHVFRAYPVHGNTLTSEDLEVLKALLQRLESSLPVQEEVALPRAGEAENKNFEDGDTQPSERANLAEAEKFLSARDFKAVRNDSSKKSSGCFGRKMDRIGSMSSLGCAFVGRSN